VKILYLVHQFLPCHIGGTELYTLGLATHAQQRGHQAEVATFVESASGDVADFQPTATRHADLPVTEIPYNLSVAPRPARYEYDNPFVARQVEGILERYRPDVVHATHLMKLSGASLEPAIRRRLPLVVTLTDFWSVCGRHTLLRSDGRLCGGPRHPFDCLPCMRATHGFTRPRFWPWVRPLSRRLASRAFRTGRVWPMDVLGDLAAFPLRLPYLRRMLRAVDRIIVLSEFQRRLLVANGVPERRMEVVPHGTELPARATPTPAPEPGKFAYVGSLAPHKGLHVVLEALARDPGLDVTLDVYGDGPPASDYAASLRQRTAGERRIVWRGRIDPPDLASAIGGYAGLVVPALWYENNPLIVQLALTLGVRVIASRLGTLEEMLVGRPGHVLVAPGEARAWAEALRRVAEGAWPSPIPVRDLPTWGSHAQRVMEIYAEVRA